MTIKQFIEENDHSNAVILLEGKRVVFEEDQTKLTQLGQLLATLSTRMKFRSGNAEGADYYFSKGVASVDKNRLQVITPYAGHREKSNLAGVTYSLDDINLAYEHELIRQSKSNKKTANLIDKYVGGKRDRYSIKAAYIIRDTIKVLGSEAISAASFGLFYDDILNPKTGGTGHTMHICEKKNIPVIDQHEWFKWLLE